MKTFAAAGIIAAAFAVATEATSTTEGAGYSLFDGNRYYSYGFHNYEYPEFDHKEEHSPAKKHHKKASSYKTNNIDIFAHSDSDDHHDDHSDDHQAGHHGRRGHRDSHSSHSSDDEHDHHKKHMKHKKHMLFLTGEGPEGDHCHEGDWCSSEETSSDYTDSDY